MDERLNLEEKLTEFYSRQIPEDKLNRLLAIQKKHLDCRKDRFMPVPFMAAVFLTVLFVSNYIIFKEQLIGSEPESILTLSEFATESYCCADTPAYTSLAANVSVGSLSSGSAESMRYSKMDPAILLGNTFNHHDWQFRYHNSQEMRNGATAERIDATHRVTGQSLLIVIFRNIPDLDNFAHPYQITRKGLNIRFKRNHDTLIAFVGKELENVEGF